jgi:hypothetical protein
MPLEPLLTSDTAEMVCFAFEGDFELGCFFVQNYAANWVFRQFLSPNLNEECGICLLLIVVKKEKVGVERS